jgi:rare lipoprotein A (peptidoglycan hydrolase)
VIDALIGLLLALLAASGGYATWYDAPSKHDAAAGPLLRERLGDWRGRWVTVSSGGKNVTVRLTDWCACGSRHGSPTLIDLDDQAFRELAPLSRGVIRVTVEPVERALPATDTEG